jgi:uncharacterized protein
MKNLLEFLLIHLCNHPEDVSVEESQTDRETVYTLHVHPEDMGRVIGKNGSIIQAIRSIAKVRAVKEGIRAQIVLADPELDEVAPAEPEVAA